MGFAKNCWNSDLLAYLAEVITAIPVSVQTGQNVSTLLMPNLI